MLDEIVAPRPSAREHLDAVLERPFGEEEARKFDQDRWGMSAEAMRAAQAKEAMFGDATYGE